MMKNWVSGFYNEGQFLISFVPP
ncbi:hypothetical protein A2U01_0112519 [Trifolium medium]|uniref:Uncharacterized protein n=1 Tax=Trifolium medium TaxID=97028 RepID=A0A392VX13_9FABA|nr:hypothetical protein [Trifolium medium]